MALDHNTCYRAIRTRDARFDGRFFTGVHSTGIYCRPVCPARIPKQNNVDFYACAAAAEDAGFRPCRRCRPETAPGTPAGAGLANGLELRLSYREPFDYEALLAFLAARAIPGVESVRDSHYRRTVSIEEDRGVIDVSRKLEAKYLILPRRTARDSRSIRKWRVAT
jgi:hypothetical protein